MQLTRSMAEHDDDDNSAAKLPQLPQELCEAVIDNLSDHQPSLAACGLVCRAWTFPTRRKLFHLVEVQCGSPKAARFFDILTSPGSCIQFAVCNVILDGSSSDRPADDIVHFIDSMDAVTCLTVYAFKELTPHCLHSLSLAFPDIISFSMVTENIELSNFLLFVSGLKFLEELYVYKMAWGVRTLDIYPAVLPQKLRTLFLCGSSQLLASLLPTGLSALAPPINTLHLHRTSDEVAHLVIGCLRSLGTILRNVLLDVSSAGIPGLLIN